MAVEYASDQAPEDSSEMESAPGDSSETTDIPVSMLEGKSVSPGDVVRLEVVSNNEDSGTITVKYASEKPMASAIDSAASKFEA